jgi:hypothetical protein
MITGENILHYTRELIVNSRLHKFVASACITVLSMLFCCDNLLPIQFIFVARLVTMIVGTVAGSVKEWFRFFKLFKWGVKLIVYFTILFFWLAIDNAFDTTAAFNFFYIWIILDMVHSFLKHAPVLGIWVPDWILKFLNKVQDRVSNFFLNKLGLDESLSSDKPNNDWSDDLSTNVPDSTDCKEV